MLVNLVGNSANLAFCGFGALLAGAFNLTFFPLYYRDPDKVGVPFAIAAAVQFVLIAAMVVIRHVPGCAPLSSPDPQERGIKIAVLLVGLTAYGVMTFLAARIAGRACERADL